LLATPLAACTTFGIGGAADFLVETRAADEIVRALSLARQAGVPTTMLGGGSNVLVSDDGIRGLVIRARGGTIDALSDAEVRADAGVTLNALVRWTVGRGLAGVEAWAGTPGTVGGAIHGNAHYGKRLIGDLVDRVRLVRPDGTIADVGRSDMGFAYDRSRLQTSGEVLLWSVFAVRPGADPSGLREVARRSLATRRRTQPLSARSAGCVFQNPDPRRDPVPPDMPASAGALIDGAGLKGRRIGGARISDVHANFIVNEGGARAADVVALIGLCQRAVFERYGIRLREEVVYLGQSGS
jgi:UDP-N-acetylmuramate dehydrogenase